MTDGCRLVRVAHGGEVATKVRILGSNIILTCTGCSVQMGTKPAKKSVA